MGFKKICIVGTGLIGASMALAFKRKKIVKLIIGVDQKNIIDKAISVGIIDEGFESSFLEDAVVDADLIILATPIRHILEVLPLIANTAKKNAVITDVGSSKEQIVAVAQHEFRNGAYFIGGHPMAGSEKRGLNAADPFLFENCHYVLTPTSDTPQQIIDSLVAVLEHIGAKVLLLNASEHDRIAAAVSHLPQTLAICLVNMIQHYDDPQSTYLRLAAGGFRDMTRIASSNFGIWQDIFASNSPNIIKTIDDFIAELQQFKQELEKSNLQAMFEKAAHTRISIPKDTKGFIRPHFDLAVFVEDKPGVIAKIAGVLADNSINIRDIEVLKVRLYEGGTIRLSFESEQERQLALKLLKEEKFVCQKR